MQRVYFMSAYGTLFEPATGAICPATEAGRIVAMCPLWPEDVVGEYAYLVVIDLLVTPQTSPGQHDIVSAPASSMARPAQSTRALRQTSPLVVQRTSRLWFECSRAQRDRSSQTD
jgi:hypothetical protein